MGVLREVLTSFTKFFKWWIIVAPWEQALRVRGGKKSKRLRPGVHFRIPFWDRIYLQSVRLRASSVPTQTLSTMDGYAVAIRLCLLYQIIDLERVYETVDGLDALNALASSAVADFVTARNLADITPKGVEDAATAALPMHEFGLDANGRAVRVLDIVFLKKAYRLITGDIASEGYWDSMNLDRYADQKD